MQIRFDAFDSLNQVNFNNPNTSLPTCIAAIRGECFVPTTSSTFGVIAAGTRYAPGDFGTCRQIQLSMKLIDFSIPSMTVGVPLNRHA